RAFRRARQSDAGADAGIAALDLGERAQDRAIRHARHRGSDFHGESRRGDDGAPRSHQGRGLRDAGASAPLHDQDVTSIHGTEATLDGGDSQRGIESRNARITSYFMHTASTLLPSGSNRNAA